MAVEKNLISLFSRENSPYPIPNFKEYGFISEAVDEFTSRIMIGSKESPLLRGAISEIDDPVIFFTANKSYTKLFHDLIQLMESSNSHKQIKCGILLKTREKILLTAIFFKEAKRYIWGVPKGGKNDGETVRQCALREFNEETGLQVQIGGCKPVKLGNFYIYVINVPEPINVDYGNVKDKEEIKGIGWFKYKGIDKSKLNRITRLLLEKRV